MTRVLIVLLLQLVILIFVFDLGDGSYEDTPMLSLKNSRQSLSAPDKSKIFL